MLRNTAEGGSENESRIHNQSLIFTSSMFLERFRGP